MIGKRSLWFMGVLAVVVCIATQLVGCKKERQAQPTGTVNIGVVMSLSGPMAPYGQECLNGLKLAIERSHGTNSRSVNLVILDDKGDSIETVNSATQLIEVNKVDCLVGAIASTNTLAMAKVAQESQVPLLVPVSTNAAITKTGNYVARTCFNDPFQGRVLAKFARENLKASRAVIVTDKAIDYSIGLSDSFKQNFILSGGQIGGEVFYTSGDGDFSAVIATVKDLNPDVIFIPGQYGDVGAMLKQSKTAWSGIHKLGGDGWDSPDLTKLAGDAAYGSFICSHFSPQDSNPKVKAFVDAFKQEYGDLPGSMGCLGYDGGLVLLDALSRIDEPITREKIRNAINSTKNVDGVSGLISITPDREVVKDAVILEVTPDGFAFNTRIKF